MCSDKWPIDPAEAALRRFPLVARPHIPCLPLQTRLTDLTQLIDDATTCSDDDGEQAMLLAVAHNKAALIASDHGLPDLARDLCWRHHDRYRLIRPWTATHARLALEPLVNLARLDIRNGRPDSATTLLKTLWHSVENGGSAMIDGRSFSTNGLIPGSDDHDSVRRWLWSTVLSEGLRALAAAGRWTDAHAFARQHHGVGRRLLDGRQIAILAHATTGSPDRAMDLIAESDIHDPWERAVAACLTAVSGGPRQPAAVAMVDRYLDIRLDIRHTMFAVRLGLTIIDLTADADDPDPVRTFARLRDHAAATTDAYVARELLNHPAHAALLPGDQDRLRSILTAAHLHDHADSYEITQRLLAALDGLPEHRGDD